ncbi:hypothetical protein [Arthrobacter sp. ISL-5]|uniref:hypothetical protein n=1 Tax=Arthrobacter sp. ISL-5 TaxID=2819111 RepID=UPI001BEC5E8E|nr:hypothetical protein [Arthrobacter sp. ISL-5]MBT2554178.1 hypothetical protein [Arthrobacter sp. ISL-5]
MSETANVLDDPTRTGIAIVFDVLLPGTEKLPAATAIEAQGQLLDRVLTADPTLEPLVRTAATRAASEGSCTFDQLKSWMGADLERLAFALHAAYYMSGDVRSRLGYPGQGRNPVSMATPDQLCSDELIAPVLSRGAIYVPTPTTEPSVANGRL